MVNGCNNNNYYISKCVFILLFVISILRHYTDDNIFANCTDSLCENPPFNIHSCHRSTAITSEKFCLRKLKSEIMDTENSK